MTGETSIGGAAREFPPTHWSALLEMADPAHPDYARHLEDLMRAYWKPVYYCVRFGWRRPIEDAKELTQEFFARLLKRNYWQALRPEQGSFRAYLKGALRHFMSDVGDMERVRRPPEGRLELSLEQAEDEWRRFQPQGGESGPDEIFDRWWVREVLREAVAVLKDRLKSATFEAFRLYYLQALEQGPADNPTYADVAQRLGVAETDVRNYLTAARVELKRVLLDRVRQYASTAAEAEEELRLVLFG